MRNEWQPRQRAVAELAARQHGVISIRQLLQRLGFSKRGVSHAVGAGRLHPIYAGVYAVGHVDLSLHGRCLAALLSCGPGSLLSHYSAAWLWDLGIREPAPFHVTAPGPRRQISSVRRHRARNLVDEDRALVDGIPVTSVARTALDLAARRRNEPRQWRDERTARLIHRAEELGHFDLAAVQAVADRNRGHHGSRPLLRAAARYRKPPTTRSNLERRTLVLLEQAGLPRPATGYNELGYELDLYWPEARFAIELDTFATHGTRRSFHEDRRRHEDLTVAEIEMIRITDERLDEAPDEVVERIRARLERRRGAGARFGDLSPADSTPQSSRS
jgi:hypothetical protein